LFFLFLFFFFFFFSFSAYAAYELFDHIDANTPLATATPVSRGRKNGFCRHLVLLNSDFRVARILEITGLTCFYLLVSKIGLLDSECQPGSTRNSDCSNQGVTAGCGDIYTRDLQCQWVSNAVLFSDRTLSEHCILADAFPLSLTD
jgi:hypothetical protein